jgi:hypothetical protein
MAEAKKFLTESDLPMPMLNEAASAVKEVIAQDMEPMEASKYVKSDMTTIYGGRWLCFCGRDF